MTEKKSPVLPNPWAALRQFTDARIALGRAGVSLPTAAHLDFQLAHARARDAVHVGLDAPTLVNTLGAALDPYGVPVITRHSAAADRPTYLQRPDLGRRLNKVSRETLEQLTPTTNAPQDRPYDVALVVADGLSALAVAQNAAPFLSLLMRPLSAEGWRIAPLCIAVQGRVAIGDEIGELLGAKMVVIMIGERPGLSSPDSMGLYMTWMPQTGLTDASRNCISNVRPAGMSFEDAAAKLHYLLLQARARELSGVLLKDETSEDANKRTVPQTSFLLPHHPGQDL